MRMQIHRYSDATSLSFGLTELAAEGLTPRGLLFLALGPHGEVHLAVPERFEDVARLRVGEKLGLGWDGAERLYHFDSVHRLGPGHFLFHGDRRLIHTGAATDVAGAVTMMLKQAGAQSVFLGCTPHQPGCWLASRAGTEALHDEGFVGAVRVDDHHVLARRILDHRLWLLTVGDRVEAREPVFASALGNIVMLERRLSERRLVLNCERGLIEVDVADLPEVREHDRVTTDGTIAVVGRIAGHAFAVTSGTKAPWGIDGMGPALLIGAASGSLQSLGRELARMAKSANAAHAAGHSGDSQDPSQDPEDPED